MTRTEDLGDAIQMLDAPRPHMLDLPPTIEAGKVRTEHIAPGEVTTDRLATTTIVKWPDFVSDPVQDLVRRLSEVVGDPERRGLQLHWSDVELVKRLARERDEQADHVKALRKALSVALAELAR